MNDLPQTVLFEVHKVFATWFVQKSCIFKLLDKIISFVEK